MSRRIGVKLAASDGYFSVGGAWRRYTSPLGQVDRFFHIPSTADPAEFEIPVEDGPVRYVGMSLADLGFAYVKVVKEANPHVWQCKCHPPQRALAARRLGRSTSCISDRTFPLSVNPLVPRVCGFMLCACTAPRHIHGGFSWPHPANDSENRYLVQQHSSSTC